MKNGEKKQKGNAGRSKIGRLSLGLLLILAGAVVFIFMRGYMLDVRTYSVSSRMPGHVKIVCLTDLHGTVHGKKQSRIVKKVRNQNPDLIVYLGDMVERSRTEQSAEALVVLTEQLSDIAPIYYVDGNHELNVRDSQPVFYEELNRKLAEMGAVQLENEIVTLEIGEDTVVNLCGISTHYYWGEKENHLSEELSNCEGINVLLCHYPESVIWYQPFNYGGLDLALCGHTHGGLVRVPFKGGFYAPEYGRWPKYDLGEYPIYTDSKWKSYGGGTGSTYLGTMIISGGLAGEHGIPRLNNPMDISVVNVGR